MNPKIITTFIMLVLIFLAGFFLVLPQIGKVQSQRADFAKTNETLAETLRKVNITKEAIADFEGLGEEQIGLVQDALPRDVDLPNLFILLEFIISSSGLVSESVAVQALEADQSQPGDFPESAVVNLALRGNYESFKAFLATLEKSLRIFDVESISFSSPSQTKEGFGSFRFSLILKTYFSD